MIVDLHEVSKMTGIDADHLRKMRSRDTTTLKSGPPYHKAIDAEGNTVYKYKRAEVDRWMKRRAFQITAGDAARILGISRTEILSWKGVQSWEGPKGKLVIQVSRNIYIWIPKVALKKGKLKKKKSPTKNRAKS